MLTLNRIRHSFGNQWSFANKAENGEEDTRERY